MGQERCTSGTPESKRQQSRILGFLSHASILVLLAAYAGKATADDNCTNVVNEYGWTCTFNENASNQLHIWSPWYQEMPFILAFINSTRIVAAKSTGYMFVFTLKSWGNVNTTRRYSDELQQALVANEASAPELFAIGTRSLGFLQDANLLYNITDKWNDYYKEYKPTMISTVQDIWEPKKDWYAIPFTTDTMFLVYNKDAFTAKNLTFPPFRITYEQLYNLSRAVNNTATSMWGFGVFEANAYSSRIIPPLVFEGTNRIAQLLENTSCTYNTSENLAALTAFTDLWTRDNVAAPTANCDRSGDLALESLLNSTGGVAMMILPPGSLALLQQNNPDAETKLGVSALPRSFLGGVGLAINNKSPGGTRDTAWDIITQFVSPENEFLKVIAQETYSPPPIHASDVNLAETSPWNATDSRASAAYLGVLGGVDFNWPDYSLPETEDIESEGLFRCMLADIVQGKMAPSEALADFCNKVENIVNNYCPLDNTNCKAGNPPPPPAVLAPAKKETSKALIALAIVIPILLVLILVGAVYVFVERKMRGRTTKRFFSGRRIGEIEHVKVFTIKELSAATDNFSQTKLLGTGGFGEVYAGVLPNGVPVAVKRLKEGNYDVEEEFLNEVKIISGVRHKNLVGLLGYCIGGGQVMLAYELMPKGSLEDALFGDRKFEFSWEQMFQILMGTAEAISYLHTGCQQRIIHRDIKPANILLDKNLKVRVSDFGMAKDTNTEDSHISTRIMGTLGYLDPSYSMTGQLTEKSDVYSYGMVAVVALLGRKPFEYEVVTSSSNRTHGGVLAEWVQWAGEEALERVQARFPHDYNEEEGQRCLLVALLCIQLHQEARPTMSQVVQMLKGETLIPRLPPKEIPDIHIPEYSIASSSGSGSRPIDDARPIDVKRPEDSVATFDFSAITPR